MIQSGYFSNMVYYLNLNEIDGIYCWTYYVDQLYT